MEQSSKATNSLHLVVEGDGHSLHHLMRVAHYITTLH